MWEIRGYWLAKQSGSTALLCIMGVIGNLGVRVHGHPSSKFGLSLMS